MNILDRYVWREWFRVFVLMVLVTTGMLILFDLNDDLGDYLGWGASVVEIAEYYGVLSLSFLPTVLPVSFLISLLFSLGSLHQHKEIIAMRACGCSLWQISRVLWLSGLVLTGLLLLLNGSGVPWSVERARIIKDEWQASSLLDTVAAEQIGLVENLTFAQEMQQRRWLMNRYSTYAKQGYGVQVSQLDEQGRELKRVLAAQATFDESGKGWRLQRGREVSFDVRTGDPVRSLWFEEKWFADWQEDPKWMVLMGKRVRDLSLLEVEGVWQQFPEGDERARPYQVRYYAILATPFACFILLGVAIPFAVSGVRVSPVVGVSKCVALVAVYYVIYTLAGILGSQGVFSVMLAAWLPNGVMMAVAGWLFWRAQ